MDENEYRQIYHNVNQRKCVFEKAIVARRCTCSKAQRFHLADREGVSCLDAGGNHTCSRLLEILHHKTGFALHLTRPTSRLPHAKEIKVQIGGMLGIQKLLYPEKAQPQAVEDIFRLTQEALHRFGRLEALPYEEIVRSIVNFKGRERHRSGKDK